jgi:hypothetical protein
MKTWPRPQRGQYAVPSGRMDRIAVIGCGGSGKTYVARRLAERLKLPLTHLDGVYYDADWNPLPQDDFAERQRELVARPRWVIEGNYASTLPIRLASADTVIFLDLPAITCLAGILQRHWRYRGGQHGSLRPNHLELRTLHLGLPQDHATESARADRRAQRRRPTGHLDQPCRYRAIPRRHTDLRPDAHGAASLIGALF